MLLIVNCQNGFLDKCPSNVLRNIIEAAEMMDNVWILTWVNPPDEAFHKKLDWKTMKRDYEIALYPELAQLGRTVHPMRHSQDLSPEIYAGIKDAEKVYIIGANTENWILDISSEIWSTFRIMPRFIYDAWLSVGEKGYHLKSVQQLTRQFGAVAFQSWDSVKAPIIARREALARAFIEAEAAASKSAGHVEPASAPAAPKGA